jgi:hypothetical protein
MFHVLNWHMSSRCYGYSHFKAFHNIYFLRSVHRSSMDKSFKALKWNKLQRIRITLFSFARLPVCEMEIECHYLPSVSVYDD